MTDQTPQGRAITELVDMLRLHTESGCFACGPENPIGMKVDDFALDNGDVTATFLARHTYQGTTGALHGGISATALDEILVWAGILQHDVLSVTAKMEVRYHRPVETSDGRLLVRARVDDRSGKRLKITGELEGPDGRKSVSASGLYLVTHTMDEIMAGIEA